MRTPTTREPKKSRGRRAAATTSREGVGIVSGADIIAVHKVEVESTDYAQQEYGVSADQVTSLDLATDRRYRQLKRSGQLATLSAAQLRKLLSIDPEIPPVR